MEALSQTTGIVALVAVALAALALTLTAILAVKFRRLRADQQVVLGPAGRDDLTAHAADLHRAFVAHRDVVDQTAERLDARVGTVEQRVDSAVAHRALVRYDAYGETAGKQSITLALLDRRRNGVVLSSIAHRETARLYCKPIRAGEGEQPLSPEEQEAIRLALAGDMQSVTLDT